MGRESGEWIRRSGYCLLFAAVCLAARVSHGARRPRRIAIVPLENLRPNTDTDWIGVGAAETLTTKLGELPDLITVERTRIRKIIEERRLQAALGDVATAVKVGRLVRAERMLVGSYAKVRANVQFNVRVVDVATGVVLNRASVVRPEAKIFDALYALAEAVIESFKKKGAVVDNRPAVVAAPRAEHIVPSESQAGRLKEWGTTSPAAYKAYCEGCRADSFREQIGWYTKAIALDPGYVWAYNNRGGVYVDRGNTYKNKGDNDRAVREYDRAIGDFDRTIGLDPKYAAAYNNRAAAYDFKGSHDRAVRDYGRAIELNPKYVHAYFNRGNSYLHKEDYDRAIRDYGRASELDPKFPGAYHNRAIAYRRKGDSNRAIREYSKAIEVDPKRASSYYSRGDLYFEKGDYDEAIRDFDSVLALTPSHFLARDSRRVAARRLSARRADDLCFIATAAYGSSWEPNVVTLRRFRDQRLMTNAPGRWAVGQYYRHSPPLADAIAARPWARAVTRVLLTPAVILAGAVLGNPSDLCIVLLCLVLLHLRQRRRTRRRDPAALLGAAR